jgi:uncharacterized DUF497 family protein
MEYEWDDAKAAAILAKHGVDFIDAIGALADRTGSKTSMIASPAARSGYAPSA